MDRLDRQAREQAEAVLDPAWIARYSAEAWAAALVLIGETPQLKPVLGVPPTEPAERAEWVDALGPER